MQTTIAQLRQTLAAAPEGSRRVVALLEAAVELGGVDGCGLTRFDTTARRLVEMGHVGAPTSYSGRQTSGSAPPRSEILIPIVRGLDMVGALHVASLSDDGIRPGVREDLLRVAQHALPLTGTGAGDTGC